MRSRLLALSLLVLALPALAVEIEFATPQRTGPAAYNQYGTLASNGIDYLVAWTTSGPETHVYATQVLADGTVPQEIATQLDAGMNEKAAWGVSISAGRDGYFASWLTLSGVTFAALDSYGRVERTSSIAASSYGGTATAWDGSTHLVLYGLEGGETKAALVDDNANVIAANIAVSDPTNGAGWLIADGHGFLVLLNRPGTGANPDVISARRIHVSGAVDPWIQLRTVASRVTSIAAIYDGTRDVIAWTDGSGIWKADLDPTTNVFGASVPISPVTAATWVRMTLLNGQTWIVWWEPTTSTAFAAPLNADGSLGTSTVIGHGYVSDIDTNGQSILSIRSMERAPGVNSDMDVIGRLVSPSGNDFIVSKSLTDQEDGDLASDGTTFLAVWDEQIGNNREIFAARHPLGSVPPDGPGVQISSDGFNSFPTAASNGTSWLIAWIRAASPVSGEAVAVARRFSSDGHLLDSEDIVLGPAATYPKKLRVASDGSNWVVAWLAIRGGGCGQGPETRPMLARVLSDGAALDPGGVDIIASVPGNTMDVDLAWDGSRYVTAWVNYCSYGLYSTATYNVAGAFISPDITHVEVLPLSGALTSTGGSPAPRVTANATGSLFAWERGGNTEYVVAHSGVPKRARSRAVGSPRVIQSVEGSLVGVCPAASGELMILTRKKIPSAINDGVFFSIADVHGTIVGTGIGAILDGGEKFKGHVARAGAYAVITNTRFSAIGGANREWMTVVDSPR